VAVRDRGVLPSGVFVARSTSPCWNGLQVEPKYRTRVVAVARAIMGEAGHATGRAGPRRTDRAAGLAAEGPCPAGGAGRPAGLGRPGGDTLPCGAWLRPRAAPPHPPPALPPHPAAGRTGSAL